MPDGRSRIGRAGLLGVVVRVGIGYDSHRFSEGRPLILGGVEVPDAPGLSGHSDGDAVLHAVIDAMLGAVGAGDIGRHFPPDDERWKDVDSSDLLERTVRILVDRGVRVGNVDVTVVCERPRIGPYAGAMRERMGRALGISSDRVSVKGKTNEGMGWIGAGEGLAVLAVVTVEDATDPGSGGEDVGAGSTAGRGAAPGPLP